MLAEASESGGGGAEKGLGFSRFWVSRVRVSRIRVD